MERHVRLASLTLLLALPAFPGLAHSASSREERGEASAQSGARPLPFIADDYARALGEARARSLPLFIEAWAPW